MKTAYIKKTCASLTLIFGGALVLCAMKAHATLPVDYKRTIQTVVKGGAIEAKMGLNTSDLQKAIYLN